MAKYKAYPEYKDSGVEWLGEIPIHWEMLRHKYVAFFTKGKNPTNLLEQPLKNTLPYLSMECLRNNTTDKYALVSNDVRVALEGQPLVIWDGSNAGEFVKGKSGILSSTMAAATLTYPLHSQYYWYLCISIEPEMRKNSVGMGIPHVNGDELKSISFGIPSIYEQKQIAEFLDHETAKIDHLNEKQQQLIELLKEKRQAVISHAVTKGLNPDVPMKDSGVEWLGDVPQNWDVVKGGYIGRLFGSESVSESSVSDFGQLPFIKVSTLSLDSFVLNQPEWFIKPPQDKNYKPESNYIVFPKRGAAIFTNKVNLVREPSIIDPNLMGWKIKEGISDEYVAFLLKKRGLSDIADVSTVPQINNKHIAPEKFPLPPYEEQLDIVIHLQKSLSTIDDLIAITQKGIEFSQERRTALISAAVTGKIDIRDWVAPGTQDVGVSPEATV